MITEILRKQLEAQLEFIYGNIISFLETFYTPDTLSLAESDNLDLYIAYTHTDLYVQCHWVEDGEDIVTETNIDYEEYNKWYKEVSDGIR